MCKSMPFITLAWAGRLIQDIRGHPDDGESHPYVDLRQIPELIARIPEARGFPSLHRFLSEINGPQRAFRTMGCITIPHEREGYDEGHSFAYEMRSYIDVGFNTWGWGSDPENIFVVYYHFTQFVHNYQDKVRIGKVDNVQFRLNLKPAALQNLSFWSMEWWTFAYGSTQQEAIDAWSVAIEILQEFLIFYSPEVESQIKLRLTKEIARSNYLRRTSEY